MPRTTFAVLSLCAALAAQAPLGRLTAVDGRTRNGALTVDGSGRARIDGPEGALELGLDEVLAWERDGAAVEAVAAPDRVWLRSGLELPALRLTGRPAADGKPSLLVAELPCGVAVELPLGALAAFRHGGTDRPEPPSFAGDRAEPAPNLDLLYVLKDGKSVRSSVTVTSLGAETIDFDLRGKSYDFAWAGTTGIVFGRNTGFAADRQGRPRTELQLATGERLEGRLLGLGATAKLRLDEGAVVEVPADKLARLSVASDRLRWLGELKPQVEQTPAFDRKWPWTVDRSVGGPGFVLGGRTFARGLGMVPRTRLTFELGGEYDVFEAVVGIDDRGGPQAHADFRVLVDDKVVWQANGRTRGMPPETVHIDLAHGKHLALEVDFGKNYDLGDYCAFADARVVRK